MFGLNSVCKATDYCVPLKHGGNKFLLKAPLEFGRGRSQKQIGINEVMKTEFMLEKGGAAAQNQRRKLKKKGGVYGHELL